MERHVPRGGGNSLKPSHNHGLWQVGMFNNLALWGEKKFVSEQERTYKFQRGVYCHTEDNSPKYRMVGNGVGLESQTHRNNCGEYRKTVITRSDKRHSNLILLIPHLEIKDFGPPASGGHGSYQCLTNVVNRLRNKCAMTWNSDMKENNFTDKVYSLFTTHHSLINNDTDFSRFT